jgi:predicted CXXCH cytochrome family protein
MKTGTVLLALLLCSVSACASDIIIFESGMKFDHQEHKREVGMCSYCHESTPGKIPGFGKEWAHKTCIGCHKDFREGPVTCAGCHKQTNKKE